MTRDDTGNYSYCVVEKPLVRLLYAFTSGFNKGKIYFKEVAYLTNNKQVTV